MTHEFESFAPLPKLMMNWIEFSLRAETSLEPELVKLIQIRASQINGCANFINAHMCVGFGLWNDYAAA